MKTIIKKLPIKFNEEHLTAAVNALSRDKGIKPVPDLLESINNLGGNLEHGCGTEVIRKTVNKMIG